MSIGLYAFNTQVISSCLSSIISDVHTAFAISFNVHVQNIEIKSSECSIFEVMKNQKYFNIDRKKVSVKKDNREYCCLTLCHFVACRCERSQSSF